MKLRPGADLSPLQALRKLPFSDRSRKPAPERLKQYVDALHEVRDSLAEKIAPGWSEELLIAEDDSHDHFRLKGKRVIS